MEGIKENVLLSKYSTFRIGGPARYLIEVSDPKDIKRAIEKALELNLKFLVIGGEVIFFFQARATMAW